jgi:hypothetical protein
VGLCSSGKALPTRKVAGAIYERVSNLQLSAISSIPTTPKN